jgi:hypothetical protein
MKDEEEKVESAEKIRLAVKSEDEMVIISLGVAVNWISLNPMQAIKLAELLRKTATEVLLSDP